MAQKLVTKGPSKNNLIKALSAKGASLGFFNVDEKLLNGIINAVADPIFIKDKQHRWVVVNDSFCKFMGQSRVKIIGKSDYDFFPKKEADVFWSKDEQVFKAKQENINQEEFTDAKGVTHTIITKKKYFQGKAGEEFLVGIISDITDRKNLEKTLLAQKLEQETILDSISAWIFYKDNNNKFVKVNRAFALAMGKTKEELEGQSLTKLYPKEQAEAFWKDDQQVIASGKSKLNIIESINAPTGILWLQTDKIPYRDNNGKIIGVIGFTIDITAQKLAEDALHQTTDRLLLATRAGGIGIWDYDVINNKLIWDDQMYKLYGITANKFGGAYEAWRSGLYPDDMDRGDKEIQMALQGEKEFNTEFRVLWPNKTIRYIRAIAIVERDKKGKAIRMVGTNWDITETKKATETINQKLEELEKLNKLMVGRELKMAELKNTIEKLKKQIKLATQ